MRMHETEVKVGRQAEGPGSECREQEAQRVEWYIQVGEVKAVETAGRQQARTEGEPR